MENNTILETSPAVFAVGRAYEIMVPVREACLIWIQVGERVFADSWQGIMRSDVKVHRVRIPMEALDEAGEYTVISRVFIERSPYFPQMEETQKTRFLFHPVRNDQESVRIYHIADVHSHWEPAVRAANASGRPDLLVMNGDLPEDGGSAEHILTIYKLAEGITGGNIPIVFARGNHDCRGTFAEHLGEYIPLDGERTYYTFRLGPIWGVVLDCGEDKPDDHPEYGGTDGTIWFHAYRQEETAFLKRVAENRDMEYNEESVRYRFVIVHNPFTRQLEPPFDIEKEIYSEWAAILKEQIHPDLMLCGHIHETAVYEPGGEMDHLGQPCPVVVGADPLYLHEKKEDSFVGAAFVLQNEEIRLSFTDSKGKVRGPEHLWKV